MRKKKLQVFISSTYLDLKEERQAAVQAILTCGHIPAGMELFTAGDESQMDVIKRWIEESDVYLLILGGRYGSVEPKTGKSYTHLEYEYAVELGKPLFAVVVNDKALGEKVKEKGREVLEGKYPKELQEFRNLVLSKMVKFYSDERDIKLAVHETMSEFERRDNLVGWIPGDQEVNTDSLVEEMARLTKENSSLRTKLSNTESLSIEKYNGLTFDELIQLLKNHVIDVKELLDLHKPKGLNEHVNELKEHIEELKECMKVFNDSEINLFHFFYIVRDYFIKEYMDYDFSDEFMEEIEELEIYGLIKYTESVKTYFLTEDGRKFYLKLLIKYMDKT